MGKLEPLITDRLVAFDTAPLIYYIEESPDYLPLAAELFETIDNGSAAGLTSVLTLQEVLVRPLRDGRHDIADRYREILTDSLNISLKPIGNAICETAAELRSRYNWLRTPDALQVATALHHQAEIIVTNDDQWQRLSEIEVVVLSELL